MFYLNNERITLNLDQMKIIGRGKEGVVYQYNSNRCLKIFHCDRDYCDLLRINEDKFKFFTTVKTKHIILPEELLYNASGKIQAYFMPYVNPSFDLNYIRNTDVQDVLQQLNDLRADIEILNEYNILMNDLKSSHLLYDQGFYLIDSSLYTKYEYDSILDFPCYKRNVYLTNELLISVLLEQKANEDDFHLSFKDIPFVYHYYNKSTVPFFADTLAKEVYDKKVKTLGQLRSFYYKKD